VITSTLNEESISKLPEHDRAKINAQFRLRGADGLGAQRMERQTQAKMRNQALDIIRHVIVAESPFTDSEVFLVDLIKDGPERLRTELNALHRVADIGWEQARVEAARFQEVVNSNKQTENDQQQQDGLSWIALGLLEMELKSPACRKA
jgi:hypothetical protein